MNEEGEIDYIIICGGNLGWDEDIGVLKYNVVGVICEKYLCFVYVELWFKWRSRIVSRWGDCERGVDDI